MTDLIPGTKLLTPEAYYRETRDQVRFVRDVAGAFEDGISSGQRKRIAKCEREGYYFTRAAIMDAYPIIEDNRRRKGRPYSMAMDDWHAMRLEYPERVRCFAIMPGPVAAAMCVLLTSDVLYVQAWGDVPGQETFSPVTLLCRGIYRWCAEKGVRVMDIGIAGDPGLIRFKESLGFRATNAQ